MRIPAKGAIGQWGSHGVKGLGTLGPSPIDSTSKIGYIRVESKKVMSAVYLPYIYTSAVYLPSIYRGGKQRTLKVLTLTLYIPIFTLISDLVSDLGVMSGLFRGT